MQKLEIRNQKANALYDTSIPSSTSMFGMGIVNSNGSLAKNEQIRAAADGDSGGNTGGTNIYIQCCCCISYGGGGAANKKKVG
ncbi:hypothetical protein [Falsibacillus pallidus]|uniref:hypothetical protein n=1 Tax=Falsibacillus pallidus TaxID=493781 RepID=UPI003D99349F